MEPTATVRGSTDDMNSPRYPTVPPNRVIREGDVGVGFTQQVLDAVRASGTEFGVGIRLDDLREQLRARMPWWHWLRRAHCSVDTQAAVGRLVTGGDVTTEVLQAEDGGRVWVFPTERPDEDWPEPGDVHQRGGRWVWRNHTEDDDA